MLFIIFFKFINKNSIHKEVLTWQIFPQLHDIYSISPLRFRQTTVDTTNMILELNFVQGSSTAFSFVLFSYLFIRLTMYCSFTFILHWSCWKYRSCISYLFFPSYSLFTIRTMMLSSTLACCWRGGSCWVSFQIWIGVDAVRGVLCWDEFRYPANALCASLTKQDRPPQLHVLDMIQKSKSHGRLVSRS